MSRSDNPSARHARCYAGGTFVADPLHYLALIERKPGALDARLCNKGAREFSQMLRLLEKMPLALVTDAVREAIQLGVVAFEAVKLVALARIEQRPARRRLGGVPAPAEDGREDATSPPLIRLVYPGGPPYRHMAGAAPHPAGTRHHPGPCGEEHIRPHRDAPMSTLRRNCNASVEAAYGSRYRMTMPHAA